MLSVTVRICVLVIALGCAPPALAQGYPGKPLRLIAAFPTGASQILAHLVAEKLNEALGQPVVVDYRPGGGSNIGAEVAAKSPPDGYTLVLLSASHATSPSMYRKLNYDALKDFAPISLVSQEELAQFAHARPGKLSFGSGGVGSSNHLASELFKLRAKS